ncbi:acyl-CoA dehydrogenase [Iodidimonas muriae]|uniref:Acyl-CoA dehydrogenase n=1 Tax=Iodidimonas muriae TaxID=261467 RepID=A0ABQ2LF49_9PROT|nr:acyl-CoA dehydrogenase family protein [Iodidimonas muriae]GER07683.1 acyl-CoA dehydrogenase [Kordiimonadales bacterium JCM 17843]GGO14665.1 acyl-CoA dehydrogenase [Iodidimonas muriae]
MADKSFLDWPFFDDHHRSLAHDLDVWAKQEIAPLEEAAHENQAAVDALCGTILGRLAAAGWLRYVVPKAHGGMFDTLDVRSLCLIRETLARHSGLADFVFAMQGLGSGTISLFGSPDLQARYLPEVAKGKKVAAFALSEPDAGSDVAAMRTTATPISDGYLVNGEKTWISNGGIADFYTLFARTGEAPGARGISAFVVDAQTPGLSIAERIPVIAPHPLARLSFKDMMVPQENRLHEAGSGFKAAMATLDIFRSTVGAAALGFARRALEESSHRVTNRHLFGAPMAALQLVQAQIADMALDIDASALLIYRAAWTKDVKKTRVTREAAMAKLYATDHAQNSIDKAVQIFGGLGVRSGHPVEKLYREIRALRIYEGASEVQKLIIARQVLEQ